MAEQANVFADAPPVKVEEAFADAPPPTNAFADAPPNPIPLQRRNFLTRLFYGIGLLHDPTPTEQAAQEEQQAWQNVIGPGSDVPAPGQNIMSPGFSIPREPVARVIEATTPLLQITRQFNPATSKAVSQGIAEVGAGLVEGVASPGGVALAAGSAIPGVAPVIGGVLSGLAAKQAGETLGEASVTGDTKKLTEGALGAALAPAPAIGVLYAPGLNLPKTISDELIGRLKQASGETMPRTTLANREAGEAGARYGSSQIYAPYASRAFSFEVLPKSSSIDTSLFGAALTENGLRGRRAAFQRQANNERAAGNIKEADQLQDMADNVSTLVGPKQPFADEATLRSFVQQPEVIEAVKRLDQLYKDRIDPLAEQAGLNPANKPEVGDLFPGQTAFINLFVPEEGSILSVATVRGVNPAATMKRGTKFQRQRTGASDRYGVDFHDMVANAYAGFLEVARKNEFDKALQDAGLAVVSEERPSPDFISYPYQRQRILGLEEGDIVFRKTQNDKIWLRKDIAQEYETVSNVVRDRFSGVAAVLAGKYLTRFQMLGIMDAAYHTRALVKGLAEVPMAGTLTDPVWSGLLRSDLIPKTQKLMEAHFLDPLERSQRLAELANIGALSAHQPYSWTAPVKSAVKFTEENVRLALDSIFDDLAAEGKFAATETNRREFINRGLQYNKRFQGPVVRTLRETAIGPFVTAGRAGLARGLRRYTLSDWAEPADSASRLWIAGNVLSKAAGTAMLTGLLNYLQSGEFTGRSGTPLGNVDTGLDAEDGSPLSIPLADMVGNEIRGGKALGLRALATSELQDLDPNQTISAMVRESVNTISHPGLGPLPQAAYGALTGKQIGVGLPEYPSVPPGESQTLSNLRVAAEHLNPVIVGGVEKMLGVQSEHPPLESSIAALGIVKGQKPERFENADRIADSRQLHDFADWVAQSARKIPLTDRREFLREQKERIQDPALSRQYQRLLDRLHPSLLKRE